MALGVLEENGFLHVFSKMRDPCTFYHIQENCSGKVYSLYEFFDVLLDQKSLRKL